MIKPEELEQLHEQVRKERSARLFTFGSEAGGKGATVALVFLRYHTTTRSSTSLFEAFELDDVVEAATTDEHAWELTTPAGSEHLYPAGIYFKEDELLQLNTGVEVYRPCLHLNGTDQHYHYNQPTGPARCTDCGVPMIFDENLGHWVPREIPS